MSACLDQNRYAEAHRDELARLVRHFHGALRAQLKPLAHAIGVGERTIRNNANVIRINGVEVRPSCVNGRVTFDLDQVAAALALGKVQPPPPARAVKRVDLAQPSPRGGRARKRDLAGQLGAQA